MSFKLVNLESVSAAEIEMLRLAGVVTTGDLIRHAAGRVERCNLAERSGVAEETLLRLVRAADLMRIVGINEAHTQLLDALDAGSVGDLRRQDAALLIKAMRRKNVELTLVRSVPPESNVARWISDARALPLILEP
jgi:hypothetical protein